MIVFLEGTLREAHPVYAVIVAGGVGYGVHIPLRTAERLPPIGSTVQLHTRQILREDASELFGFIQAHERDFFDLVTKVSGIGPRTALNLLSRVSTDTLQSAISSGDTALLSQCPGIGKKTAERLVVELRDKLKALGQVASPTETPIEISASGSISEVRTEAVAALTTLGFKFADAEKTVEKVLQGNKNNVLTTEDVVRQALKSSR